MDRYQRVERPRTESAAIEENEIRITAQGLIRNYVSYATSLLQERRIKEIVLKAMGQAISKSVAVAEIIKKRIPGLHQDTNISSVSITDVWEPIEEGLVPLEMTRHVSMISITLSPGELDKNTPGPGNSSASSRHHRRSANLAEHKANSSSLSMKTPMHGVEAEEGAVDVEGVGVEEAMVVMVDMETTKKTVGIAEDEVVVCVEEATGVTVECPSADCSTAEEARPLTRARGYLRTPVFAPLPVCEPASKPSMRPYIPKATFAFCHSLLASRLLPSAAASASSPLLPVQAILTTAGLLPRHPDLSLLALNSLLHALSRRAASPAHPGLALRRLRDMLSPATPLPAPDHLSFPFALSAAAAAFDAPDSSDAGAGAQLHALLVRNALFPADHYVTTALLQVYAPRPELARRVLDELPRREAIHYDLVIGAYARAGMPAEGLAVFRAMFEDGVVPDAVVLTTAVAACAQAGALDCGAWVHRYVERAAPGLLGDAFVGSALVTMYAKCGCLEEAARVFDGMPERNEYVWGTMVGAFAVHGMAEQAVASFVADDQAHPRRFEIWEVFRLLAGQMAQKPDEEEETLFALL
ncbi:putative pentatricopeptide repeat-containing protein [Panicum miliaceum]|uniref:Pentatricopeptide repeat-containing protein n=1 Tax=Panicum miliaceum TaxID=4540 RepID=A0A3L6S5P9_PANMI|nr:putative pentatricopeptide repeat-containing protein [Panicum miliaceum]